MKIGLVCPYNIAKGGAVLEIVRAMQHELQSRGHTVLIITPQPRAVNDADMYAHKQDGVIFVGGGADFNSPLHTTSQVSMASDVYGIDNMLHEEAFDILHFHEPWVPMLSRQILGRSRSVNIATFHAKLPGTMMSRTVIKVVTPYTKAVLRGLDALTAVSEPAAEYVCSLTDAEVTIIPNGIDLAEYPRVSHDNDKPKKRKTILYVGRLEKRKGVSCLLSAYSQLTDKNQDVELVIAGDGPDREKLEHMAKDLELPHVRFMGYVSDAEKKKLLASADLFVAPALYGESFGLVLLEAMSTGIVTVAGNNPGYASVMQDLGSISLVNPKDPMEFARRMDVLLRDEGLRKLWQKWARQYVRQFSYTTIIDQYEEIYKNALAHQDVVRQPDTEPA